MSTIADGTALNITVQSYRGGLDFGLIADAELVPDLDALLAHIIDELSVLGSAVV